MSDQDSASVRRVGAQSGDEIEGARPPRRKAFFYWLILIVFAIAQPFIDAANPLAFTSASDEVSSAIVDRVMAPFYGYDAEEPRNVAASTRNVAVILIDDQALQSLGQNYPIDYFFQYEMFSRIMQFDPQAIFVDLLYSYDRGGLGDAMALIKDEADATDTQIVFASLNATVDWTTAETHESVSNNFKTAGVAVEAGSSAYSLWHPIGASIAASANPDSAAKRIGSDDQTYVAGVALTMLKTACTPAWSAYASLKGCQDAAALFDGTDPPETDAMILRYGTLNQEAWQAYGDLAEQTGEAFYADAAQVTDGCRHFPPDFEGRFWEAARQVASSAQPFRKSLSVNRCAYTLTIPLEQLMNDSVAMNAYLAENLKDKIVFLGSAVVGASDRVKILDAFGPGVYAHAAGTDNLLNYGTDYFHEPPGLFSFEVPSVGEFEVGQEIFLEMAISLIVAVAASAAARQWSAWVTSARSFWSRNARRIVLAAVWTLFVVAIVTATLFIAIFLLRWSSHNWVGALTYAYILRNLLGLAEARAYEESS